MKNTSFLSSVASLMICLLLTSYSWAQSNNQSKPSPPATAKGKVGQANVTINYSSPAVKGRKIWGELVPYDKVWRAGANEATIVEFDRDVVVEGKPLPAGKYSFFTIPGEDQWTVIFNKETGQWGTRYDESQDALRVQVTPRKASKMSERLAYDVNNQGIVLRWENMEVPVSVKAQ